MKNPTLLELARKYRPWTFLGGGFQDFLEKTPELATLLPFKLRINNIIWPPLYPTEFMNMSCKCLMQIVSI